MNALQREQVQALAALNIPRGSRFDLLIRTLSWRVVHKPSTSLSWRERFELDCAVYCFRETLSALAVCFLLPIEESRIENYRPFLNQQRSLL